MGIITRLFGLGEVARGVGAAVEGVAEVYTENRTAAMQARHDILKGAQSQFAGEFAHPPAGWFDSFVNGLNRLPRPTMAFGTLALFVYAMADPVAFAARMQGLAAVPEPLWWLMGAVVSFYFGARELHHVRARQPQSAPQTDANPIVQALTGR
ncbi:hypothetical protein FHS89_000870 [Rubricella aquisinus]|uniref:Holin of 3TMs, for gene-transfer release n=1 Tax=Rubricella aquisinus TaxID=2028108 RepID=A0A840WWZ9_9RHOB|nr:holin family protein [Rubricella aquisinus]MBB5514864.1 hypothetical protein [Rubricella aquisinus]